MLRQNKLRDLADHRESGAETIIALGLMKGLEQLGLLDAHQLAVFLLDVPDLDVREDLERRVARRHDAQREGSTAERDLSRLHGDELLPRNRQRPW